MKLIAEWKKAWRMLSVQLSALGAAVSAAWVLLPHETQESILSVIGVTEPGVIAMVGFVAVVYSRIVYQPKLHEGEHEK